MCIGDRIATACDAPSAVQKADHRKTWIGVLHKETAIHQPCFMRRFDCLIVMKLGRNAMADHIRHAHGDMFVAHGVEQLVQVLFRFQQVGTGESLNLVWERKATRKLFKVARFQGLATAG